MFANQTKLFASSRAIQAWKRALKESEGRIVDRRAIRVHYDKSSDQTKLFASSRAIQAWKRALKESDGRIVDRRAIRVHYNESSENDYQNRFRENKD